MKNFNNIQEAKEYASHYFFVHHNYVGYFDYRNNKGIIQFFSVDSPNRYFTFECTVFASKPLKRPVGRPKGPEKVYIGFKIEPRFHAEVKALVKEFIRNSK